MIEFPLLQRLKKLISGLHLTFIALSPSNPLGNPHSCLRLKYKEIHMKFFIGLLLALGMTLGTLSSAQAIYDGGAGAYSYNYYNSYGAVYPVAVRRTYYRSRRAYYPLGLPLPYYRGYGPVYPAAYSSGVSVYGAYSSPGLSIAVGVR